MFKPFKLIDLSILSDKEIEQHGIAALFEMLLKHHDTKHYTTCWRIWLNLICLKKH